VENFKDYSKVYNLIYTQKDYDGEALYVHKNIQKYNPGSLNILELGCGSGIHANSLSKYEYNILGIDMSQSMINEANSEVRNSQRITLAQGDARFFRSDKPYENIISLFHVLSYMSTNEDVEDFFKSAYSNLMPDGLLIFDFWYSPAVQYHRPETRIKRISNDEIEVFRVAEPKIHENDNLVDVNYSIFYRIKEKQIDNFSLITETHTMRHFSLPEILFLAQKFGFEVIKSEEFLSGSIPSRNTWGVCTILKKTSYE